MRSIRGMELRPTSDRLRETLFNVLTAGNPAALEGTTWLDLYAGTGAVGIEALSRGAKMAYFVESSPKAAALIQANLQSLQINSGFEIIKMDIVKALQRLEAQARPDFIFLDPPYHMHKAYRQTLELLARSQLLLATSTVIAEHDRKFDPGDSFDRLHRYRKLQQGDAALSFYRLN